MTQRLANISSLFLLVASAFAAFPATAMASYVCHKENCVSVDVVSNESDMERGLIGHKELGQDQGMLFVFNNDTRHQFWMKNMTFDLDIVWISFEGRIVYIGHHVPACKKDPCPIYSPGKPSRYVVELNSGYTTSHGWNAGDYLILNF